MELLMKPFVVRSAKAVAALVLVPALASLVDAQGKRRLSLIDLLNVPRLTDPQLSPDGRQIVYDLAEADWKVDKRVHHIWRINADGSGLLRLTSGAGEQGARW